MSFIQDTHVGSSKRDPTGNKKDNNFKLKSFRLRPCKQQLLKNIQTGTVHNKYIYQELNQILTGSRVLSCGGNCLKVS